MWLMGFLNPSKFEQSCECTFLKFFTYMNTKWILKNNFIIGLQCYELSRTANPVSNGRICLATQLLTLKTNNKIIFWFSFCVCMGKDFQKSALSTFFKFYRARAAYQPHVLHCLEFLIKVGNQLTQNILRCLKTSE